MKAFECKMCGECCYGEGGIFIDRYEAERIARFGGLTPESFIKKYCEERSGRISIKTGPDNFCIFFGRDKRCLIHPVKPEICILWPFYPALLKGADNWKTAQNACPGINPDCPFEDFVKQSKE